MKVVNGDEDYMVITNAGQVIRSPLTQVRECGRNSQGVKIITLKEGESVSSLTVLPKENDEENVEEGVKNTEENSENSPARPTPADMIIAMDISEYLGSFFLINSILKAEASDAIIAPKIGLILNTKPAAIPARDE